MIFIFALLVLVFPSQFNNNIDKTDQQNKRSFLNDSIIGIIICCDIIGVIVIALSIYFAFYDEKIDVNQENYSCDVNKESI